jgi:hypothetical protein
VSAKLHRANKKAYSKFLALQVESVTVLGICLLLRFCRSDRSCCDTTSSAEIMNVDEDVLVTVHETQ